MEKIIKTFKNLYSGEIVIKKHWLYALVILIPTLAVSAFQIIDKDNSDTINLIFGLIGLGLFLISIPLFIFQSGIFIKFMNNKLNKKEELFPLVNSECFILGLKSIPISLVWIAYFCIIALTYIAFIITALIGIKYIGGGVIATIIAVCTIIMLTAVLYIGMILISPFVNLIIIKFANNIQYTSDLFNPITPFRFMRKSFKSVFITALKYFIISCIFAVSATLLSLIVMFFIGAIGGLIAGDKAFDNFGGMFVIYIFSSLLSWGITYISGIISFGYMDNLCEVYLDNIKEE